MVDVPDAQGRALLKTLLAEHPEWEAHVKGGGGAVACASSEHPCLEIPSEHPTIRTPLTVELGGYLRLFWNASYFFDFPGICQSPCVDAVAFLRRFFAEEILWSLFWKDGLVAGGGPIETSEWRDWPVRDDRLELRSWRGTHDRDVYPE